MKEVEENRCSTLKCVFYREALTKVSYGESVYDAWREKDFVAGRASNGWDFAKAGEEK